MTDKTTEALKLAEEAMIKKMSVLEQAMKLIETPLGNDEWRDGRGALGDANRALAFIREMLAYHSYIDPIKSDVSVDKAYLRGLRAGYSLGQMESEVDLENPIQGVSPVEQRFRARVQSYEKSIKEAEAAIREALAEPVKQEPVVVGYLDVGEGGYLDIGTDLTDDQIRERLSVGKHNLYAAPVDAKAIRAEALEEAAKWFEDEEHPLQPKKVAAAIRGMK